MDAALVITTHNQPEYLGICLKSLLNQSTHRFAVFIADDGSGPETAACIRRFQGQLPVPVTHFHQRHDGSFGKPRINNQVFRATKDYPVTICVDGDTFCHRRFVEDHLTVHTRFPRALFMGRRIDLGPKLSRRVQESNVLRLNRGWSAPLLLSAAGGDTRNLGRAWRIAQPWLQEITGRTRVFDLVGSNFSVATPLLHEVNGYNEAYRRPFGEDGELFVRLRNSGATLIGIKSFAIQYHMHHKARRWTSHQERFYQRLLQRKDYRRCRHGIVEDPAAPLVAPPDEL